MFRGLTSTEMSGTLRLISISRRAVSKVELITLFEESSSLDNGLLFGLSDEEEVVSKKDKVSFSVVISSLFFFVCNFLLALFLVELSSFTFMPISKHLLKRQ